MSSSTVVIVDVLGSLFLILTFSLILTSQFAAMKSDSLYLVFTAILGAATGLFALIIGIGHVIEIPLGNVVDSCRIFAAGGLTLLMANQLRIDRARRVLSIFRVMLPTLLPSAIISFAVLAIAIRYGLTPPGNDVIAAASIIDSQHMLSYSPLCFAGNLSPAAQLVDTRFEACGAWLLGDLFDVSASDSLVSNLLLPYLLTPIYVAAGLRSILNCLRIRLSKPIELFLPLIAVQFLIFPWAINGLSRFTFGLVMLFASFSLLISYLQSGSTKYLVLFALNYIGMFYIHTVSFALLVSGLLVLVLVPSISFLSRKIILVSLTLTLGIFLIVNSQVVDSTRNILAIALGDSYSKQALMGTSNSKQALTGTSNYDDYERFVYLAKASLGGTNGVRAQPVLTILAAVGITHLLRSRHRSQFIVALVPVGVLMTLILVNFELGIFSRFRSEQLRLMAIYQASLLVPLSVGTERALRWLVLKLADRGAFRKLLISSLGFLLLLNIVTGLSIYATAWARQDVGFELFSR